MLAALFLLAAAGGASAAPAKAATPTLSKADATTPAVSNVVAEQADFHPSAGETASWRYRTAVASRVTTAIYDGRDVLIRTLAAAEDLPAGDHRLAWDGRDDRGRIAPPGYYLLTLASESGGETARYDPSDTTGGELTQAGAVRYDSAHGLVRYALQKPSLLRIHLGLKDDGPLLRTLVDWVARGPGEHAESWDGWDVSRVIRFADSPKLDIQVWAYALPVNAVVVDPPASDASAVASLDGTAPPARDAAPARLQFLDFPEGRATREKGAPRPHEMYNHWQHDRTRCHNPAVGLEAVVSGVAKASGGRTASGTGAASGASAGVAATVDGPLPLRLNLAPEEAAFLQDERFETVIYVDGVFAFEEEQGYLPFTWSLKPEMLTPGEHVLTFMVRGYEGHFGSSSLRVVRPGKPGATAGGR